MRLAALGDKPVPAQLERERVNIDEELARQSDLILAKQREIAVVNARYDADKLRWQQLRVAAEAQAHRQRSPGRRDGYQRQRCNGASQHQEVIFLARQGHEGRRRAALVICGVRARRPAGLR